LADRLLRQYLVHEQRRRLGHAPGTAARAEAAALAAECNQLLGLAGLARDPKESVLEQAALQIGLKLLVDVPRQRTPFGRQSGWKIACELTPKNPLPKSFDSSGRHSTSLAANEETDHAFHKDNQGIGSGDHGCRGPVHSGRRTGSAIR
jgi:hypothetical protein